MRDIKKMTGKKNSDFTQNLRSPWETADCCYVGGAEAAKTPPAHVRHALLKWHVDVVAATVAVAAAAIVVVVVRDIVPSSRDCMYHK